MNIYSVCSELECVIMFGPDSLMLCDMHSSVTVVCCTGRQRTEEDSHKTSHPLTTHSLPPRPGAPNPPPPPTLITKLINTTEHLYPAQGSGLAVSSAKRKLPEETAEEMEGKKQFLPWKKRKK